MEKCIKTCFLADYSQEIEGDYYVVERYESDVEEDKSGIGGVARDGKQQVMIRLSEDFLEEIDDTSGMVRTYAMHLL